MKNYFVGRYGAIKDTDFTPDTLRYYERVGVIPEVNRTKGGICDYSEQDI